MHIFTSLCKYAFWSAEKVRKTINNFWEKTFVIQKFYVFQPNFLSR